MSKLPIFGHFLSVGNLKPKLELFFKPKIKPKFFYWIAPQSSSKNEDGNDASKKGSPTSNGYEDPYEKLVRGNLERLEKEKVSEWIGFGQIPPQKIE